MAKALTEYQLQLYTQKHNRYESEFARIVDNYLKGGSLSTMKSAFKLELRSYYIQLALLAKGGRSLTPQDKTDLGILLAKSYDFLDGFVVDLEKYNGSKALATDEGAIGRGARYSNAWHVYSRYSIPAALADVLPALPGQDCLGMSLCGCWLEWGKVGNVIEVYWRINPIKEHCVLCVDYTTKWDPYEVDITELDPGMMEDDIDFINGD
jgi:hypothetical protein